MIHKYTIQYIYLYLYCILIILCPQFELAWPLTDRGLSPTLPDIGAVNRGTADLRFAATLNGCRVSPRGVDNGDFDWLIVGFPSCRVAVTARLHDH